MLLLVSIGGTAAVQADWYRPSVQTSVQIQLQGDINQSYPAELYDIDLFDSSPTLIRQLKASGRHVVCYFSAGSYEDWRKDATQFERKDLGRPLAGWAGERWLDIRSVKVRGIMQARLNLAVDKGCEGVDPDNVDGYTNKTGFPLTAKDQLAYNRFLAQQAHQRGLAVGLKNDLPQVASLVTEFDFAVNEQCHEYDECGGLQAFITAAKPVFNLEYRKKYVKDAAARQRLCADAQRYHFRTLVMPLELDGTFRISCDG